MKKFVFIFLLFFSFGLCYAVPLEQEYYQCAMGGAYNKIIYNTNGGNEIAPLYVASYNVKDFSFPGKTRAACWWSSTISPSSGSMSRLAGSSWPMSATSCGRL